MCDICIGQPGPILLDHASRGSGILPIYMYTRTVVYIITACGAWSNIGLYDVYIIFNIWTNFEIDFFSQTPEAIGMCPKIK